MLQFIYGLARSGKTTKILSIANDLTKNNNECIIIVPEQSTFETEKAVLKTLGDTFAQKCEVLSFSRLYDDISRKVGGICARVLKDSDKVIFMSSRFGVNILTRLILLKPCSIQLVNLKLAQ